MIPNRLSLYATIAFIALFGSGRALTQRSDELTQEFHQTYPMTANGRVTLENINGSVHITTWDRNEVKLDAVKRAFSQQRLDEARIDVAADPNSIHIQTRYPDYNSTFNNDDDRRKENPASVEYTMTVPQNARLDSIELINGALDIRSARGEVKASSINGRVLATGLAGDVNLSTINGSVDASFEKLNDVRQIRLGSVNGSVSLVIPSDANAELHASTVHGPIENQFGIPVKKGEYVGRSLSATLGRGGVVIKVDNVNGPISIRHASDNRPLSNVTNTSDGNDDDADDSDVAITSRDADRIAREAARDAREAARDAQAARAEGPDKEAIRAQVEAARAQADAARVAEREVRRAQIDAIREVDRVNREVEGAMGAVHRGGAGYRLVERDTKNFKVSGVPRVSIQTFTGTVSVRAWDKNEVSCAIAKRAADDETLRHVVVESSQNGNAININARYDIGEAKRFPSGVRAEVNLEILVPRNANLTVSSGDGRLGVDGVAGELVVQTGDGPVYVSDSSGRLKIQTGDGSVRVDRYNGDATIHTGDGRMDLQGRFSQLTAQTGDGSISLELASDANSTIETHGESVFNDGLAVEEPTGSKRVRRWRVGTGGSLLKLQTADGRIFLRRAN